MDNNDSSISKIPRKTYSRELLRSLQTSELSNLWPKSLDKTCTNGHNQWDPVKSFENSKTATDTKRTIFSENKPGYRNNNDKTKDDISLRPERRRWNDGCQVTNNKRNGEDSHSNSYRKSYQNTVSNCGGGDYERSRFNRNPNRNSSGKIKDSSESKATTNNNKPEKSSRNNSNLEEKNKDDKDEQKNSSKNINNSRFNNRNSEPEWFLDGPENCEETIELRGITANDNEMLNFKVCSTNPEDDVNGGDNSGNNKTIGEKLMLNLMEKSILTENGVSPKREGSRFQDIFLKEKKINHMNESKDVEKILKAVLADNVSKTYAKRLNNVSKPLPNGVPTLEEIEKDMTSGPIQLNRTASKSTTIDTLNSFEPSLNSLLSSGLSSPSQDNSKVVNWLSGLTSHGKEPEIDKKQPFNESPNFCNMNTMMNPLSSPGYSKFVPSHHPPPGLPLMINNNQLQQQHHSQLVQQQLEQQNKLLQSAALLKHIQMSQSNNMNQPRNILPFMFQQQNQTNEFDGFMGDKYKRNSLQSMPNDNLIDQNTLSSYLRNTKSQMNHIQQDRSQMLSMNGPPGLANLNMMDKNMMIQPRPIVKTSSPQMFDLNFQQDFNKNLQNNLFYQRSLSANNASTQMHNLELNKTATVQMNPIDMYSNMRNRDLLQKQTMLLNNYSNRQSFIPSAHEMNIQSSSSNKMLANLFNVSSSTLPPLPQQAKYADQIETENN